MGHLNKISSAKDLPADAVLIAYLKEASLLNKNKVKPLKRPSAPKKELEVPQLLADELKKNKKALTVFEAFSSSNRREYIEWINEAKTEETMNKRLATTIEWLKEGKSRNWKYKR